LCKDSNLKYKQTQRNRPPERRGDKRRKKDWRRYSWSRDERPWGGKKKGRNRQRWKVKKARGELREASQRNGMVSWANKTAALPNKKRKEGKHPKASNKAGRNVNLT